MNRMDSSYFLFSYELFFFGTTTMTLDMLFSGGISQIFNDQEEKYHILKTHKENLGYLADLNLKAAFLFSKHNE